MMLHVVSVITWELGSATATSTVMKVLFSRTLLFWYRHQSIHKMYVVHGHLGHGPIPLMPSTILHTYRSK